MKTLNTQWWTDIVNRHSLEHAVLVLFYGSPHEMSEWTQDEIRNLIATIPDRRKEFFLACVRQAFGAHLNTAEKSFALKSLALLKNVSRAVSPCIVPSDEFYHLWTVGAGCRHPAQLEPFLRWLIPHSGKEVCHQGVLWLMENAQDAPAHTMYWNVIADQIWDMNLGVSEWGHPGTTCTLLSKSAQLIENPRGNELTQSWRNKHMLLQSLEDLEGQDTPERLL